MVNYMEINVKQKTRHVSLTLMAVDYPLIIGNNQLMVNYMEINVKKRDVACFINVKGAAFGDGALG